MATQQRPWRRTKTGDDALEIPFAIESRFAPAVSQSPFIPAKAGIQGPRTRPRNWVPASAGTSGIWRQFKSSRLTLAHKLLGLGAFVDFVLIFNTQLPNSATKENAPPSWP